MWAGEVTNDSLVPMRALLVGQAAADRAEDRTASPGSAHASSVHPQAPVGGRSSRGWPSPRATATEVAHASALQLLERNGVLTREAALAEGVEGGFAGVYPVLKALEERGQLRRGYFVAGLGATQFALPGAVDRLRAQREGSEAPKAVVLAATDPAQVYGASLPWPTRRAARPALRARWWCSSTGSRSRTSTGVDARCSRSRARSSDDLWADTLAGIVKDGRVRSLELHRIDGEPASTSPVAPMLRAAGFVDGYRGLVLRS